MNTVKRPRHGEHSSRPWWPKSPREVEAVVGRLASPDGDALFAFLAIAAAGGEWKIFQRTVEVSSVLRASEAEDLVRQVGATPEWSAAYANMSLPRELFPFLIKILELRLLVEKESPEVARSAGLRPLILKKAQLASGVAARLSPALKGALSN